MVEHKVCTPCVLKRAKAVPNVGIRDVQGKRIDSAAAKVAEYNDKRFSTFHIELPYKEVDGKWMLMIEITDYYKKHVAEFGFTKEKLLEFIEQIDEIEQNEKLKPVEGGE